MAEPHKTLRPETCNPISGSSARESSITCLHVMTVVGEITMPVPISLGESSRRRLTRTTGTMASDKPESIVAFYQSPCAVTRDLWSLPRGNGADEWLGYVRSDGSYR